MAMPPAEAAGAVVVGGGYGVRGGGGEAVRWRASRSSRARGRGGTIAAVGVISSQPRVARPMSSGYSRRLSLRHGATSIIQCGTATWLAA